MVRRPGGSSDGLPIVKLSFRSMNSVDGRLDLSFVERISRRSANRGTLRGNAFGMLAFGSPYEPVVLTTAAPDRIAGDRRPGGLP